MAELRICIAPSCTTELGKRKNIVCGAHFRLLPDRLRRPRDFRTFTTWVETVRDHYHLPPQDRPLYTKSKPQEPRFMAKRRYRRG